MKELREHLEAISEIKRKLAGYPGRIINLTISGAHLYGFPSIDSDIDYRGTFQMDTAKLVSLERMRDVIEIMHNENDIVLFELSKEIGLALNGNCNVLEHITANQILVTTQYLKMKRLINNAFGKDGIYNSYKGMAEFNYKRFILRGKSTVKKYLYVFRGLMAGIYVLQTGQIQPDIVELNRYFKIKEIKELVKLKKEGTEKGPVPQDLDIGNLEKIINDLFDRIDRAYEKCKIPEGPSQEDINKLNEFLIGLRRDYFG